jgi:hypothetical protein
MKPRARRVTITAATLGVGVTVALVVTRWGAVRDQCEERWLRLTGNVVILPNPGVRIGEAVDIDAGDIEVARVLRFIANSTGRAIIVTAPLRECLSNTITVASRMNDVSSEVGLAILRANRFEVRYSRLLRGAYALTPGRPLCEGDEPVEGGLRLVSGTSQ